MTAVLTELAGWTGAGCMLLAYALLSTRRLPTGPVFQILNIAGALGLTIHGATHRAWPSASLNLAWLLIGLVALHRQLDQAHRRADQPPPRLSVAAVSAAAVSAAAVSAAVQRAARWLVLYLPTGELGRLGPGPGQAWPSAAGSLRSTRPVAARPLPIAECRTTSDGQRGRYSGGRYSGHGQRRCGGSPGDPPRSASQSRLTASSGSVGHSITSPSGPPEASVRPSGEKVTALGASR